MSIIGTPACRPSSKKRDERNASPSSRSEFLTPQSKYSSSVLISATATRVNGRIAITPTTRNANPCTLSSMRRIASATETPSKAAPVNKAAYPGYGRRLPMNMVVSQVASRRPSSPVRELKERYLVSEPPSLDPLLDQLLNFNTPGAKTGSLPHPDDLMGGKLRKYRRMEGPEDDIHKAFVSIYGGAEASLSVSKKLRLTKNNENDNPLDEECHNAYDEQILTSKSCLSDEVVSRDDATPVLDSNAHYLELYGSSGSAQRYARPAVAMRSTPSTDPISEIWKSFEASPPPRKFVTSNNFLKTASEVSKENNYVPQQESTWKKYLNNKGEEEDTNPCAIESLGNSCNQRRNNYSGRVFNSSLRDIQASYVFSSQQEFNFMPCSPNKPDAINSSLEQTTRVSRRDGGMPESAECRWLYEANERKNTSRPRDDMSSLGRETRVSRREVGMPEAAECRWLYEEHERENTSRPREDSEKDDDELAALLLQSVAEKESIFSTSSEGKETYYYSSDE